MDGPVILQRLYVYHLLGVVLHCLTGGVMGHGIIHKCKFINFFLRVEMDQVECTISQPALQVPLTPLLRAALGLCNSSRALETQ